MWRWVVFSGASVVLIVNSGVRTEAHRLMCISQWCTGVAPPLPCEEASACWHIRQLTLWPIDFGQLTLWQLSLKWLWSGFAFLRLNFFALILSLGINMRRNIITPGHICRKRMNMAFYRLGHIIKWHLGRRDSNQLSY